MSAELYGLVLAGGRSRRMHRDKAALEYDGRIQLARAMGQLTPLVVRSFVSVRADQVHDPQRAAYETIVDLHPDLGPIAGLHAAQQGFPQHAWLVLACDLPFLTATTLQRLIAGRAPARLATAYRSSYDGQPEPLCAIFEPASRAAVEAWIAAKHNCPRAFLAQADVELLSLDEAHALDNVNTATEYAAASATFAPAPASTRDTATPVITAHGATTPVAAVTRRFTVQYFAVLREQAGRNAEEVETHARTPRELYEELRRRRGLTLAPEFLRVAVNEEFGEWTEPLADGDTVVFLPPVAGG